MKKELHLTKICLGIVYVWFGVLKFFPSLSPAEDLAKQTIHILTFGLIPSAIAIILLALWEVGLGILFLTNKFRLLTIRLTFVHLVCTFLPLFFFPSLSFSQPPLVFTLVGQYIVKNIVFLAVLYILFKNERNLATA